MIKYYKNGRLDDDAGTGVTIEVRDCGKNSLCKSEFIRDGKPDLGYLAEEITAEEAAQWQEQIANPDMVNYFWGIFRGIGVVDKKTYEKFQAQRKERFLASMTLNRVQFFTALKSLGFSKAQAQEKTGEELDIFLDESQEFILGSGEIAAVRDALGIAAESLQSAFIDNHKESAKIKVALNK